MASSLLVSDTAKYMQQIGLSGASGKKHHNHKGPPSAPQAKQKSQTATSKPAPKPLVIPPLSSLAQKKPTSTQTQSQIPAQGSARIEKPEKAKEPRSVGRPQSEQGGHTARQGQAIVGFGSGTGPSPRPSSGAFKSQKGGKHSEQNSKKKQQGSKASSSSNSNSAVAGAQGAEWWNREPDEPSPLICISEDERWYSMLDASKLSAIDGSSGEWHADQSRVLAITQRVELAFKSELAAYQKKSNGSGAGSDQKWMMDMIRSGTLSDKVAALALLVQSSPPHQLEALDALVVMAGKKEQRTAQLALDALKDLLVHNVLPDRHLVPLRCRPLLHPEMTWRTALLMWYEDQLISRVERVMEALEAGLRGTLDYFKRHCIEIASDLLISKPEQEVRLLAMIVNKLGDPKSSVCSKGIEVLRKIIRQHPAMKTVVVKEVRQFVYRPGLPARAMYSGIVFLSQLQLSQSDHDVAAQLVECYVSLFEKAVAQEELRSRLLSALLAGINKAYPYLKDKAPLRKHVDSLFRIVHSPSFTASTQALMLISYIVLSENKENQKLKQGAPKDTNAVAKETSGDEGEMGLTNRFYRALYAKLLSDQITTRARNALVLNLLFRSIKRDPSELRSMAFLKRLAMCATQSTPPVAAGLLFIISEICRYKPSLLLMMTSTEEDSASFNAQTKQGASQPADEDDEGDLNAHQMGAYDASKREPMFAAASTPLLWEGTLMRCHFHPSVKAFASSLLENDHQIKYAGDPMVDFSLTAFLNRFAYKNPKAQISARANAARRAKSTMEEPLNTAEFMNKDASQVEPDKMFFHKFFGEREKLRLSGRSRNRGSRRTKGSDDEGGSDADDFDDEADMDRFADKLAEDMMRDHARNLEDPDMDDEDGDAFAEFGADDDSGGDDDDNSSVEFAKPPPRKGPSGVDDDNEDSDADTADDDDDEDEAADAFDLEDFVKKKGNATKKRTGGSLDDSDSDDGYELMAYGDDEAVSTGHRLDPNDDDDDADEVDDESFEGFVGRNPKEQAKKRRAKAEAAALKRQRKSARMEGSDFADAEDFEEEMDKIVVEMQNREMRGRNGGGDSGAGSKHIKKLGKRR